MILIICRHLKVLLDNNKIIVLCLIEFFSKFNFRIYSTVTI